jgi:WD40 repeat protein
VSTGRFIRAYAGNLFPVYRVLFSKDGNTAGTASQDGSIRSWQVKSGIGTTTILAHNDAVTDMALLDGGKVLASTSGDGTVKFWDVNTRRRLNTLKGNVILRMVASRDGRWLVTGDRDGAIALWRGI